MSVSASAAVTRAAAPAAPRARGITMSADSVGAIRRGQKTQTRRLVALPPEILRDGMLDGWRPDFSEVFCSLQTEPTGTRVLKNPFGAVGDTLWVKETWSPDCRSVYPMPAAWYRADYDALRDPARAVRAQLHERGCRREHADADCFVCAAEREGGFRWRSPRFMPRALSRLSLTITRFRIQRVQDIDPFDANDEGMDWTTPRFFGAPNPDPDGTSYEACAEAGGFARDNYQRAWDAIHKKRRAVHGWDVNPWVWAITFRGHSP